MIATSLATVLQAALIPVASSDRYRLQASIRAPLDMMVHWDRWQGRLGGNQDPPTCQAL